MLSSLASYLFGSATSDSISQEANPAQNRPNASNSNSSSNPGPTSDPAAGDVIEVTSSTPSVAGSSRGAVRASNGKRRKNRRGKQQRTNQQQQRKQQPAITKLLTPSSEIVDEDFDEDEWYIVEKEDEEDDSPPRSDSEEELSVVEVSQPRGGSTASSPLVTVTTGTAFSCRRRQGVNSRSLYSGPRPQQQRNYLQRSRVSRPLSISTLSPPRSVPALGAGDHDTLTQSLYVASPSGSDQGQDHGQGANVLMEESCMSVYYSIRSTQEGTDSFVNLDLGVSTEVPQQREEPEAEAEPQDQRQALQEQQRAPNARFDSHAAVQLKQQTLARQSQKSKNKKEHQQLCRSAMKRANKVRDFQAKANRPRRSEMQHCKLVSGANNNRSKCCY
ncbi:cell wall protein RBR3 isoform X2 [Drosophila sechellia]|uniref:GM14658 n=1 Tax=Drosophila sechellia TaxID=7238 RepID=B4HU61_DROSE|nr:cell wall protein RBR3 isoform X2 [Drosophila sechellia]EDW50482.1 GM14658 [Drosophila sechellia]